MNKQSLVAVALTIGVAFGLLGCSEADKVTIMKPAVSKLVEAAQKSKDAGDTQTARCRLESAILLEPENPIAHYNMGILLVEDNQFEPAIESFKLSAAANKPDADIALATTYYNYALDLREKGPAEQAAFEDNLAKAQEYAQAFMDETDANNPARAEAQKILDGVAEPVE